MLHSCQTGKDEKRSQRPFAGPSTDAGTPRPDGASNLKPRNSGRIKWFPTAAEATGCSARWRLKKSVLFS